MSQIRGIDKQKALKKWTPVLESMGVSAERFEWMSEMAEYNSINSTINENAYANNSNAAGMGNVASAQPSSLVGSTIGTNWSSFGGSNGSGDVGQNLLPVSMKIAAQTIGLDLVAVKPASGPKIDLLYIDFQYDDVRSIDGADERPQVFKLQVPELSTIQTVIRANLATAGIIESNAGLANGRYFVGINALAGGGTNLIATYNTDANTVSSYSKKGLVEFLGFSRVDGYPMFRAFSQANTAHTATALASGTSTLWSFDQTRNTFNPTQSMIDQITVVGTVSVSGVAGSTKNIQLVSALEDHIPGFSANWTSNAGSAGSYPMNRQTEEDVYSNTIGPKISSKSVQVGTIEVASALRRTEIEDIKANTGMDIVQKMESILVNELSQTISKQIVNKIWEMGDLNRSTSAPLAIVPTGNITGQTLFDLDTAYAGTTILGGETTHAVQRKLITKIMNASNFIATEGRIGTAQYLITNGALAAALQDVAGYTVNPVQSKMNQQGQLYPVGSIGGISIYVDPYMRYNDNRIVIGRKNNADQPGIIFVPYLMAQNISIIAEATMAPKMLLRSRYAITEVGWYPQKQFMTIKVYDANGLLN